MPLAAGIKKSRKTLRTCGFPGETPATTPFPGGTGSLDRALEEYGSAQADYFFRVLARVAPATSKGVTAWAGDVELGLNLVSA